MAEDTCSHGRLVFISLPELSRNFPSRVLFLCHGTLCLGFQGIAEDRLIVTLVALHLQSPGQPVAVTGLHIRIFKGQPVVI